MARLSPENYDPILSFRFKIQFSSLADVTFYGKAVNLPTIDNSPLTFEYGNTQIKVKGKTKWNDVTLTMYAYEKMTMEQLWDYMNVLHQDISKGEDKYGDDYKKDIQIQLLSPADIPIATWTLVGAFAGSINFGDLDWSTEEVVQPTMVISYDYATFKPQGSNVV